MGRAPCCDKANVKKGPWSLEEDSKLKDYIEKHGTGGNWIALPQKAGLKRCGKSCRLRWLNYLRPNIKHGEFSDEEDRIICSLYSSIGSRWSIIAAQLPGRTDNDIKNYWNTKLKKKLMANIASHHHSQRKPPTPFPSNFHQNLTPPLLPSQSLASLYKDSSSYHVTTTSKSFIGFDLTNISSSLPSQLLNTNNNNNASLATTNSSSLFQTREGCLVTAPMQYYKDNFLVFGGEASCSSSDGSCSQISYGREIKQEDISGLQSYISSGFEENYKFISNYGSSNGSEGDHNMIQWGSHKSNGYFGEVPSDYYELEDVKQLISSNNIYDGNNVNIISNNNLFSDESKTQEKAMHYYY